MDGRGVGVLVARHRRRRFGISDCLICLIVDMSTSGSTRLTWSVKSMPSGRTIRTYTRWQGWLGSRHGSSYPRLGCCTEPHDTMNSCGRCSRRTA
ncbi:hypothetical protein BJV78DRAFT_1213302 [Lactifluus subvellereus]|nr:hypothetical protein BJV78DRAFT_1213302 [Lactifluus subvellereus]